MIWLRKPDGSLPSLDDAPFSMVEWIVSKRAIVFWALRDLTVKAKSEFTRCCSRVILKFISGPDAYPSHRLRTEIRSTTCDVLSLTPDSMQLFYNI